MHITHVLKITEDKYKQLEKNSSVTVYKCWIPYPCFTKALPPLTLTVSQKCMLNSILNLKNITLNLKEEKPNEVMHAYK